MMNKTVFLLTILFAGWAFSGCSLPTPSDVFSSGGGENNSSANKIWYPDVRAGRNDFAQDSLIMKVADLSVAEKAAVLLNGKVALTIPLDGAYLCKLQWNDETTVSNALNLIRNAGAFYYAEPNYRRKLFLVPDDPKYAAYQYSHVLSSSPGGWDVTTGSTNVIVAVIDSGVEGEHPDLSSNLVSGWNDFYNHGMYSDNMGHGTHVAGIIGAVGNNGIGVAGVAWNCRIMSMKVVDTYSGGDDATISYGIALAVSNRGTAAMVINLSLGGMYYSQSLADVIAFALSNHVVVVAAMGNDGNTIRNYPASFPGVIAVGATDGKDQIAPYSTMGNSISVCAPGDNIYSTSKDGGYVYMSGTSMAAPFVSGLAALLLSVNTNLTPTQVKTIIEQTADDLGDSGYDPVYGYGRVNVSNALQAAVSDRYGSLTVKLTDDDGYGMPGVTVLVTSNNRMVRSMRSSASGMCYFYGLPLGSYTVSASCPGESKSQEVVLLNTHTIDSPLSISMGFSYTVPILPWNVWFTNYLAAGEVKWYRIAVTNGYRYYLNWDDSYDGSGKYTADLLVSGYHQDRSTSYFTYVDSAYTYSAYIDTTKTEYVYLKIQGYYANTSGTFAIRCAPPAVPPTGLRATNTTYTSTVLSWDASTNTTYYYLYRSMVSNGTYTTVASYYTGTSFTNTDLIPGTNYYYRVAGSGFMSDPIEVRTSIITTPTGFQSSNTTCYSTTLTWSSSTDATYYQVYRSQTSNGTYSVIATVANTYYIDTGLSPQTNYYYQLASSNTNGILSYRTPPILVTTPAVDVPTTPTGLWATNTTCFSSCLGWDTVTAASHYLVYQSFDSNGSYALIATVRTNSLALSYLIPGTNYYYRVSSSNSVYGESACTVPLGITTLVANWLTIASNITSPNYPANYPNNCNTNYIVTISGATRVMAHFSDFNTESGWDYVYVKDPIGTNLQILTGTLSAFDTVNVVGDTLWIQFKSDGVINQSGWQIDTIYYLTN